MKLTDIGEFGFIERIAPFGNMRAEGVVKAIGDDCAVTSEGGPDYLLVTTDLLVERVHFLMEWAPAEVIGVKALAVNLSDIAACGGRPRDAFISIAVPDRVEIEWLDGFYRGMANLARSFDVNLLGGDTTGSKSDLAINVAVTGRVPRHEVLFRHTANPGDSIIVTGPLGASGAGLELLLDSPELSPELREPLIRAHLEPRPHVREGQSLASSGWCTAAIDVSDGLSSDLGHLCNDSGLGAVVYEEKIPVTESLMRAARALGRDPLEWILNGGEDYVLLAGVKPEMVKRLEERASDGGWRFFVIGKFSEGREMRVVRRNGSVEPFIPGGWDHFKAPKE